VTDAITASRQKLSRTDSPLKGPDDEVVVGVFIWVCPHRFACLMQFANVLHAKGQHVLVGLDRRARLVILPRRLLHLDVRAEHERHGIFRHEPAGDRCGTGRPRLRDRHDCGLWATVKASGACCRSVERFARMLRTVFPIGRAVRGSVPSSSCAAPVSNNIALFAASKRYMKLPSAL
jgi:hypothetical protein